MSSWLTTLIFGSGMRERDQRQRAFLASTKDYLTIKEIVRSDGAERVRIFRGANDAFGGALVARTKDEPEWSPYRLIGAGCIYDSAEGVEAEAANVIPWVRSQGK